MTTVRRTIDEILAHTDQLATRFESYEPDLNDEVDMQSNPRRVPSSPIRSTGRGHRRSSSSSPVGTENESRP